jgi:hypothetical protein
LGLTSITLVIQYANLSDNEVNEIEDFNEVLSIMPNVGCFIDSNSISKIKKLNENKLIW